MLLDSSSRMVPTVDSQEASPKAATFDSLELYDGDDEGESFHPMDIFLYLFLISVYGSWDH